MRYRLRLTREARKDIEALARYIAERAGQTVAVQAMLSSFYIDGDEQSRRILKRLRVR